MGAAASVSASAATSNNEPPTKVGPKIVELKKLPEAIEEAIYVHEKFPLIIDTTEQAGRFLKYQTGTFISFDDPIQSMKENINKSLVGALQYGRTLTLKFSKLEGLTEAIFKPKVFPKELLSRSKFFTDEVWKSVLPPPASTDDEEITISSEFVFIICTNTEYVPPELYDVMHVIKVVDKLAPGGAGAGQAGAQSGEVDPMDQIAELFGAKEVVRNSTQMVEAAFDGDLDEVKKYLDKGYHLESVDGRKHTALSEAACQGQTHVIEYLLQIGADPNSLNDTGRSSLWRAAFNGHTSIVAMLLEAGASPDFRDKVSMESAFDVSQHEDVRTVLSEWDISRTELLVEQRRRVILANLESRIKTSAEREFFARNIIRKELIDKASNGDFEGIKILLTEVAEEAQQSGGRPRATVEVRNDGGQSLLSLAAQYDYVELAEFLLTYWKEVDKDRWDLTEGEVSAEAKIFKANPNSRDLKGWTCVCIAVFHDSRKVLQLLLENGGDPNIRSSYNKNAWDLAKDEFDAEEKILKSNKEIRQVLIDYGQTAKASTGAIFGNGTAVLTNSEEHAKKLLYEGLGVDGSPIIMNIEMNKESSLNPNFNKASKEKGKGGGAKTAKAKTEIATTGIPVQASKGKKG